MSSADVAAPDGAPAPPARPRPAAAGPAGRRGSGGASWRLLGSELGLMFRRWRNLALLAVSALLPALLGIALRLNTPQAGGGGPASFLFSQVAGNGVFVAFIALTVMIPLVLPVAIAVVAGDSVAGEASTGTLRYLLAVPAGRTRLLAVKYVSIVVFGLVVCLLVAVVSLLTGVALFPVGPVTLLSGTSITLASGLLRLLLITLYIAAGMAALGAIGLTISVLTEHPIAAMAATLVIAVASEVVDSVPQFAAVGPYLPTHWWLSFDGLLRSPADTPEIAHGLLSFGVYAVVFAAIAWARFTTEDVTA